MRILSLRWHSPCWRMPSRSLGFQSDAEQSSIRAINLAQNQNLPLPEKYLISASNARIMKDNKKAIEAYENLSKSLPGDVDVQYQLGTFICRTVSTTRLAPPLPTSCSPIPRTSRRCGDGCGR